MEWIVDSIFKKEFDDIIGETITTIKPWMFFTCIGVAILLGLVAALSYMFKNQYSKSPQLPAEGFLAIFIFVNLLSNVCKCFFL